MSLSLFDEIRIYYGSDKLVTVFRDLVTNNAGEAVKSLNQKNLQFPSFFVLYQEIKASGLENRLSTKNKYAFDIITEVLSEEDLASERLLPENSQDKYTAFRWILDSGCSEDGMSEEFDQVLDTAGIVLCRIYNDKSCLRTIEELIFSRHRKGSYIYDLTWAYFESLSPQSIHTLTNRLRSSHPKDVELARRFLNFIPELDTRDEDPRKQYQSALKWISTNQNFLYYTGATNHQTTNPARYDVSLEAKYLQRPAYLVMEEQARSLKREESVYLESFSKLDKDTQVLLSNCSDILSRSNRNRWSRWLQSPIEKQIEFAQRMVVDSK